MIQIAFGTWLTSGLSVSCSWSVDPGNDAVASVQVSIGREGESPVVTASTDLVGVAQCDVRNFSGRVTLTVEVRDLGGAITSRSTSVAVYNRVQPSAPDYLWFAHETPLQSRVRWAAKTVSPSNASWRVYNLTPSGRRLLAEVAVDAREAELVGPVVDLVMLVVRGVDDQGTESADSPGLSLALSGGGPILNLEPWVVTGKTASIGWNVASRTFLVDVGWTFSDGVTTLSGHGQGSDSAMFTLSDQFVGKILFDLAARDSQDRTSRIHAEIQVYGIPAGVPRLLVQEVGVHFVVLSAVPDPADPIPTSQVIVTGAGTKQATHPFQIRFDQLTPDTPWQFRVAAVNPTGMVSAYSEPLIVRTLPDPAAEPIAGTSVRATLTQLLALLTPQVRAYILQSYSMTRVRNTAAEQILLPPTGFDALWEYFLPLAGRFGDLLRHQTTDLASYQASLVIDSTGDPLQKLALLCERLEYGSIWQVA